MPAIADDLFAGVGGWDLAADTLGVQARGVEIDAAARATRDAAGLVTIHDDVWTYQPDDQAQGLIASPPCQTFSAAGKGSGRKALTDVTQALATDAYTDKGELRALAEAVGDERTALVLLPMHYATGHGHYRWLAWEQVPAVLPVWEACAAILREVGWRVWVGLLHAEQHGVPQTRTRAVLLARQDGDALPPPPTHSRYHSRTPDRLDEGVAPWVTMAQALHPLGWPERFRMVSNYGSGGDPRNRGQRAGHQPAPTVTSKVDRNRISFRVNAQANATRRTIDQPAPTLTVGRSSDAMRWTDTDRVSVAEAGVLQGFPATFPWQGTRTQQFRQVGNAIPPPMAAAALAQVCPQAADHTDTDSREGVA